MVAIPIPPPPPGNLLASSPHYLCLSLPSASLTCAGSTWFTQVDTLGETTLIPFPFALGTWWPLQLGTDKTRANILNIMPNIGGVCRETLVIRGAGVGGKTDPSGWEDFPKGTATGVSIPGTLCWYAERLSPRAFLCFPHPRPPTKDGETHFSSLRKGIPMGDGWCSKGDGN